MHLLKSALSCILLLSSLFWFGIQHLFFTPDIFTKFFEVKPTQGLDFLQLKRDWCRVRSKKISWREIIGACQRGDYFMKDKRFATNPELSQVSQVVVKSAGEHTSVRIDTYTEYGVLKTFGGDSFRVVFRGPDVIAATVFDLRNGSYEALALLMRPGFYNVKVILDYTQCKGIKDPSTEWYVKAHCAKKMNQSGNIVGRHIASQMEDYINKEISPGIVISVKAARYDLKLLPQILGHVTCGFQCKQIWDGHGRWSYKKGEWSWIPTLPLQQKEHHMKNRSTLWIYGDSISYYFFKRIQPSHLCKKTFRQCNNTYNWIYPKRLYELRHFCGDIDVNENRIQNFFRDVLGNDAMDANSVLIFNLGAHFVKNTSFRKYRNILNALLEELKKHNGTVIWKSTTAIHHQNIEIMGAFRRYLTSHRVELFNAYANSLICGSRYNLLDVYSLTASYPFGTKDGVHYHRNASLPMERMLQDVF